ncbi:hypothetical protein MIND_00563000 [Mycena indigotica]|uniref:Uncharacterized protein n=1 Tax=Mycena indigotica TaxID=2126181 RepID=A0A8H6SR23_9AGAR|nr:uncharacterized protein MIND_00563000 [Mycena indigotica]KAF7303352.1 hypothetical protein MIND_00563000 [Mycena indigotica]
MQFLSPALLLVLAQPALSHYLVYLGTNVGGYVGNTLNPAGGFNTVSLNPTNENIPLRIHVHSDTPDAANATPQRFAIEDTTLNASTHPFIGGIGGSINTPGSSIPLGGTGPTTIGAKPSSGPNTLTDATGKASLSASAIWTIDPSVGLGRLVPKWVNEDGTTTAASVGLYQDSFVLVGDKTAFQSAHQGVQWVNLTLIE